MKISFLRKEYQLIVFQNCGLVKPLGFKRKENTQGAEENRITCFIICSLYWGYCRRKRWAGYVGRIGMKCMNSFTQNREENLPLEGENCRSKNDISMDIIKCGWKIFTGYFWLKIERGWLL
jgi:hypothetical protein